MCIAEILTTADMEAYKSPVETHEHEIFLDSVGLELFLVTLRELTD